MDFFGCLNYSDTILYLNWLGVRAMFVMNLLLMNFIWLWSFSQYICLRNCLGSPEESKIIELKVGVLLFFEYVLVGRDSLIHDLYYVYVVKAFIKLNLKA